MVVSSAVCTNGGCPCVQGQCLVRSDPLHLDGLPVRANQVNGGARAGPVDPVLGLAVWEPHGPAHASPNTSAVAEHGKAARIPVLGDG